MKAVALEHARCACQAKLQHPPLRPRFLTVAEAVVKKSKSKGRTGRPPRYSPEIRAAASAALLAGQSVSAVAKEYKIPKGTVSSWRKRRDGSGDFATQKADATQSPSLPPSDPAIGDLLLTLLKENLKGLIAGAQLMQDLDWLRTQGATEVGTLLGITNDKTVRMLEALDRSATEAKE